MFLRFLVLSSAPGKHARGSLVLGQQTWWFFFIMPWHLEEGVGAVKDHATFNCPASEELRERGGCECRDVTAVLE